jgi:peptidoglycan/LPS O-acetylase OafA/YrhL
MSIKYRPEIDGLRFFAVGPIVLFHATIPGLSGGYIGVDIFFVISGFLITSGLIKDIENNNFSIANFYERRMRRIFPALFACLIITTIISSFMLLPKELEQFPATLIGSVLFFSNIVFWRQSGYFESAAEFKPLLHTWSLGVEEQFYIFAPLIFLITISYFKKNDKFIIAAIGLASFALCLILTPVAPAASFYLIPTRAWELLAGSMVSFGVFPRIKSHKINEGLAAFGLAMIVFAITSFDDTINFPGYAAAIPVLGASLIIAYSSNTTVGKFLSWKPFVGIGLISYSLYLWHWPIIVFARDLGYMNGHMQFAILVIFAAIAIAYISWRFIETPFRNRKRFDQKSIFKNSAVMGAVIVCSAFGLMILGGMPQRFSVDALRLASGETDISPERQKCHSLGGNPDPANACVLGQGEADTLMWADSHGVEIAYALGMRGLPIKSITYSACAPALGYSHKDNITCSQHNSRVFNYIETNNKYKNIVISAYYNLYKNDKGFSKDFKATVLKLMRTGKSVTIIAPVPAENIANLPKMLARGLPKQIGLDMYRSKHHATIAMLKSLEAQGAKVIWPEEVMCQEGKCALALDGQSILFDEHHLSVFGAKYLVDHSKLVAHIEGRI